MRLLRALRQREVEDGDARRRCWINRLNSACGLRPAACKLRISLQMHFLRMQRDALWCVRARLFYYGGLLSPARTHSHETCTFTPCLPRHLQLRVCGLQVFTHALRADEICGTPYMRASAWARGPPGPPDVCHLDLRTPAEPPGRLACGAVACFVGGQPMCSRLNQLFAPREGRWSVLHACHAPSTVPTQLPVSLISLRPNHVIPHRVS